MNNVMSSETISKTEGVTEEDYSWAKLGIAVYIKIAMIALLLYWFFSHEINVIVNRWISDSSWSHGFLIPFFSLYFLNQHKNELVKLQPSPGWSAKILGLGGLLFLYALYPLNLVKLKFFYGQPLIMIAAIAAITLFLGGWKLIRYTWLPIVYLYFAVPLPTAIYSKITIPMRRIAASAATMVLNIVPELKATAHGVVIDVIYQGQPLEPSLDVAEACSGMRLLMAFVALGVAMAYLQYRPIWQRLILLVSTVPIAIFCNMVRVTVTGLIYVLWDPQYAQGIYHDMLGMMMLPLAFLLYGGLAWLMNNLFVEDDPKTQIEDVIIRRKPQTSQEGSTHE